MTPQRRRLTLRQITGWIGFAIVFVLAAGVAVWRGDILRAGLDPQVPFQTYAPPAAPNYVQEDAWLMREVTAPGRDRAAPVFFVHPTTYDGRREWLGPIGEPAADAWFRRVVAPNHVAPFARVGAISVPRYRQAGLYSRLTIRDDAREARAFAYADIEAAFDAWLARHPDGPIVLAGLEQGGDLLARLLAERVAPDPDLLQRLVAAYVIDSIQPADQHGPQAAIPACQDREQAGCLVSWFQVETGDDEAARRRLRRALVWDDRGELIDLGERAPLCVNPVNGSTAETPVPARRHLGGADATGLEWGARPGILSRQVETRCVDGVLRHSHAASEAFRQRGSWTDRRKSAGYNLFYADLEADVAARLAAWRGMDER